MFHVVQRGFFAMEKRMFAVVHRLFSLMAGADIMFLATMRPGSFVMTLRRVMMLGGYCMTVGLSELDRCRHCGRSRIFCRAHKIARHRAGLMLGIGRDRSLPMFESAKRMATGDQSLMGGMGVVLADLVMSRCLAVEMSRLFVMCRCGLMMMPCIVSVSHT